MIFQSLLRSPTLAAGAVRVLVPLGLVTFPGLLSAQSSTVNWETPHVSPLDTTPDGRLLLAVNTPDARLEVFDLTGALPELVFEVPVGLDPVSVRARSNTEAWVVNHISDSVSIVDLANHSVRATLSTEDEPADVVFAEGRAFVSCSQANSLLVFNPEDLDATPERIAIEAEDPRALAVSPDGGTVYAAIFESGNGSTLVSGGKKGANTLNFPPNGVNKADGPYGGINPPPNAGAEFEPPPNPANPDAPKVSLIVKKDKDGRWVDDNDSDWSPLISGEFAHLSGRPEGWDLIDRDVAIVDASTLEVSYVGGLMNIDMAMAVHPTTGRVTVIGTDATNEIRYEPVLNATFLRVVAAQTDGTSSRRVDLNAHIDYTQTNVRQAQRNRSIGDPRGIAWHGSGKWGLVTGMGSNNVVVIDPDGARVQADPIEVGEGPTGVVIVADRAYVLAKFESALSVIDLNTRDEVARIGFYDPSPQAIKVGRKHLYGTHETSGLGQVACASCHVDARIDRLAWDLGDPSGLVASSDHQNLGAGHPFNVDPFDDFHPMKGPMLTQTLQDIIGKEPHHWRGDRDGIEAFASAFEGLQGDDEPLDSASMQEFKDFLTTIHFPPNPFRNIDNSLRTSLPIPGHYKTGDFGGKGEPLPDGNAVAGLALYLPPVLIDQGAFACSTCHTLPTGLGPDYVWNAQLGEYEPFEVGPNGERHHTLNAMDGSQQKAFKVPHLRNLYERTGMTTTQNLSRAGFGFAHDGSVASLEDFLGLPAFDVASDQDVADLVAFMLSFSGSGLPEGSINELDFPPGTASRDTHAAVGVQVTLDGTPETGSERELLIQAMTDLADASLVGLVAKGRSDAEGRGWAYLGGAQWQSDRLSETATTDTLLAAASAGEELTLTVVPTGAQLRMGVDRDEDGVLDSDELDAGSDPADPESKP